MITTETISYHDGETRLIGWLAQDKTLDGYKKPIVIVIHDWSGRNEFACNKAEQLATLGYIGFAVDMYGDAKLGANTEEKFALMNPFMTDRARLLKRLRAAVEMLKNMGSADSKKIAAIGYCFGGLCALDLARECNDITGVVSLHGLLIPPNTATQNTISSKVLVLHGHDDPMVPPSQVLTFEQEMTDANADWQIVVFGNTKHAFSNPLANDPVMGTVYNPVSDHRAWAFTCYFLSELFSGETLI